MRAGRFLTVPIFTGAIFTVAISIAHSKDTQLWRFSVFYDGLFGVYPFSECFIAADFTAFD